MISLLLGEDEKIAFISDLHYDNRTPDSRIDDIQVTLTEKLKYILKVCKEKKVKHIFFEGDVFNRISCSHESVNTLGKSLNEFKNSGIELYTILGNHDIVRNNLECIDKSPIQTLFSFGVITHINLREMVEINHNVLITPVDYTEMPVPAVKSYGVNILLAHMFYNKGGFFEEDKHNIKFDEMKKLDYDYAFLGHDHEEFPLETCGKCKIFRTGSILRGTSHSYNFDRTPKFVILSDWRAKLPKYEIVEIECRDYTMVASEYSLNRKRLGSAMGLQDVLSNLAEKLVESNQSDGDRIFEIIKSDRDLPQDCRELLFKYIAEA